jgi:DnaJ-class molecular chaperone
MKAVGEVTAMDKESKSEMVEEKCPKCEGTGVFSDVRSVRVGNPPKSMAPTCPQCRGVGRIKKRRAE